MALYNIGTEDSPNWVEGYWEGGYGDEAPVFRRADAQIQSGNAEDGYKMIADPRISGLSTLDQRMRDLGYKELWGQYDPNGNRLAGGFLEGYWQDPATGKIYGTGQSPAQWYYGQTPDPATGGWYVGNDPEAVKQQALSYGAKARTSGGDFITNFMDAGGGVAALMALAGYGAATGFGGALNGVGPVSALPDSYWSMLANGGGVASDAASAASGTIGNMSAADIQGLTLMGRDAGLSGQALQNFVNSGGTMGSTAAGGGGVAGINFNIGNTPSVPRNVFDPSGQNSTGPSGQPGANLPGNPGSTGGGPMPTSGGGTLGALQRVFNGTASTADYLSLAGSLGSSALGYLGSQAQTGALQDTANQYLGMGAPYRNLLQASYQPGFSMENEPGYQGAVDASTNSFLRAASAGNAPGVSRGNPMDNPGAWAETMKYVTNNTTLPALNNYRSQLGTFGQLGTNTAGSASLGAAGNAGNTYNALGYGLGQITSPQNTIPDWIKQLGGGLSSLKTNLNTGF